MHFARLIVCILIAWLKTSQGSRCPSARFIPSSCHPWCVFERSLVAFVLSFSCFSPSFISSLPHSTYLFFAQHSIFNVDNAEGKNHCTHAEWGVLPHGDIQSSHRLWAQAPRRLRPLRDFCNDLPGWIRRHRYGAFVVVWCGTRRWDYRKSAIFTTVHWGARRTSEPETSLSLCWRKFVASSVFFRTHKLGETRFRT